MDLKDLERLKNVKKFEGEGFNKSYADFDRRSWPNHTNSEHQKQAEEIRKANTLEHEKSLRLNMVFGTRLLNLPYYDAIRMSTIVDQLHNFYT